jgi:hypothetical protein
VFQWTLRVRKERKKGSSNGDECDFYVRRKAEGKAMEISTKHAPDVIDK